MKNSKLIIFGLLLSLIACNPDSALIENEVKIDNPEVYTFTRNNESTVSFTGQTDRILMADELASAFSDFTKSKEDLANMFSNENMPFSSDALNASTKSIKSKVAASQDFFSSNTAGAATVKADFEEWISAHIEEVTPAIQQLATVGVAGQIADGGSTRYVSAKGLEYNQAFIKSLIGGLMTDQILNNYLSTEVLDAGSNLADNDAGTLLEGKSYTNMEHKWDEAYGYLFGTSTDQTDPLTTVGADDAFLNKYLGRVNNDPDFEGLAKKIFDAFKLGRAAIVAGEYEVRSEQADIIKEAISEVIGVRSVYYLQQGKKALEAEDFGVAFHDLSEGFGFIYSLQFTREANTSTPYFSREEVLAFTNDLLQGNGFWEVSPSKLDEISASIADKFDFTLEEAAN